MKVSGHTAAFAISKIFEENRVSVGGRLLHSNLAADWKVTGLRLGDLDEGIAAGVELGAFQVEETEDGPCITFLNKEVLLKGKKGPDRNMLAAEWDAQQAHSIQQKASKRKATGQPSLSERRKPAPTAR